jgi:hypothetical protein
LLSLFRVRVRYVDSSLSTTPSILDISALLMSPPLPGLALPGLALGDASERGPGEGDLAAEGENLRAPSAGLVATAAATSGGGLGTEGDGGRLSAFLSPSSLLDAGDSPPMYLNVSFPSSRTAPMRARYVSSWPTSDTSSLHASTQCHS